MDKDQGVDAGPLREGGKGPQASVMFTEFDVRLAGSVTDVRPDERGGVKTHASGWMERTEACANWLAGTPLGNAPTTVNVSPPVYESPEGMTEITTG